MNKSIVDPSNSFKLYFKDQSWAFKTSIGGILNALAIILLTIHPIFFPVSVCLLAINYGYLVKCLNHRSSGNLELPEFNGFIDMMLTGLSWFALATCFYLIYFCLTGIILVTAEVFDAFNYLNQNFILFGSLTINLLFFLFLVTNYFLNFMVIDFSKSDKISAINALKKIITKTKLYPKQFILAFLLNLGIFSLSVMVPVMSIIGVFLLPSTLFVALIINGLISYEIYES